MHKNLAYYRSMYKQDNIASSDQPLIVNCVGYSLVGREFITNNPIGREDYYIQYLTDGEMDVIIDGEHHTMRPGDAAVYHPMTPYYYAGGADAGYYWVHFTGSDAALLTESAGLANKRILHLGLHQRLQTGFERLFGDFITRDAYYELSLSAALTKLCLDIARLKDAQTADASSDERLDRVLEQIHRNYAKELSIAELAAGEYLSEGRLRVLFRRRFGMPPYAYITALRITSACQLLESSDLPIADVARAVGIPDALYFSKLFKKQIGVSPSEYREK